MKETGYWLIGYAYKTRRSLVPETPGGDWRFANDAIDENPADWVLRVLKETNQEQYVVIMALPISKKHYEKLVDQV